MARLPSDAELKKLFVLGRSNQEIADQYGVTLQAVAKRLAEQNYYRRPLAAAVVNDILSEAWSILTVDNGPSHHSSSPAQSLKVWMRRRLGDASLSERQAHTADLFEKRLRTRGLVLDYSRERGFEWVPRLPTDGHLAIRWPADRAAPSERAARVLTLDPQPEN
ncbi:hypothetical protein ACIRBX_11890 [Kitasatospora sp. NPDC096147]|uniref:hypothetical protein n=1 Tax=Kitasatospora sp. NPDC096147 TaxID=3364093 RepID=UPI0038154FFA